jgi:hypothetical protein
VGQTGPGAVHARHRTSTQQIQEKNMYQTAVEMRPTRALAGQPVTLTLTVRDGSGRAVSKLPLAHEQPMHVIVISRDLDHFAHLHPSWDGSSLRVEHTFEDGGEYVVVLDYQEPGNGQVVDKHHVHIAGAAAPKRRVLRASDGTERADGLELKLHAEQIRAGQAAMLHFDVKDTVTGESVNDLEPYLGSTAHFMILSADGEDFVHAHAIDSDSASRVSAHAAFPRAGLYKMWVQVQRRGAVVTVPFVLQVGAASPQRSPAAHSPGEHRHHSH